MVADEERGFRKWRSRRGKESGRIERLFPQIRRPRITWPTFPPPQIYTIPTIPLLTQDINEQPVPAPNIDESTRRTISFPV